jgi:hypothetical protein
VTEGVDLDDIPGPQVQVGQFDPRLSSLNVGRTTSVIPYIDHDVLFLS